MELLIFDWVVFVNIGVLIMLWVGGFSFVLYGDGQGGGGLNLGMYVDDDLVLVVCNCVLLCCLLLFELVWLMQVYGVVVLDVVVLFDQFMVDVCISSMFGVVCVMMMVDCLLVLFCDCVGMVVGVVYVGWCGLVGGVFEVIVVVMCVCGVQDIIVWLGLVIGLEQFEVGVEVCEVFIMQQVVV